MAHTDPGRHARAIFPRMLKRLLPLAGAALALALRSLPAQATEEVPFITTPDNVTLEMSPYDLTKGRITFRHIENRQPRAAGAPAFKRKH